MSLCRHRSAPWVIFCSRGFCEHTLFLPSAFNSSAFRPECSHGRADPRKQGGRGLWFQGDVGGPLIFVPPVCSFHRLQYRWLTPSCSSPFPGRQLGQRGYYGPKEVCQAPDCSRGGIWGRIVLAKLPPGFSRLTQRGRTLLTKGYFGPEAFNTQPSNSEQSWEALIWPGSSGPLNPEFPH